MVRLFGFFWVVFFWVFVFWCTLSYLRFLDVFSIWGYVLFLLFKKKKKMFLGS